MNRKVAPRYTANQITQTPELKWIEEKTIRWIGEGLWQQLTIAEQDYFIESMAFLIETHQKNYNLNNSATR